MTIEKIRELVTADFVAVDKVIKERLHSQVALVDQVATYIIHAGGKRLRPLMLLLAARACGYQGNRHVEGAAIIEFIHTATLLHDDVVDGSSLRRGRETANEVFGNATSVLVGDFLYSRAFQMMVTLDRMPVMAILGEATNAIAEGEVLQLMTARDPDTTEERYLEVIHRKTARLFEAAGQIGAVIADARPEVVSALAQYGNHIGTAFQLIDDALDYQADESSLGKHLGDDLAEGKPTLPLIHALPLAQLANPDYAAAWRKTIDPVKASPSATLVRPAGFLPEPPAAHADHHESPQTTHFSVVDADGNAVASTYTLNFGYGSGVTVDGLGFLLNDEMDDFASKQGVPNGFGLIQGPANAIAPGKRPLSSMTPTIISKDGQLRLVLGSPGGSTIITTVINDLISVLDNHLNIQQAADAPRFHHQYLPDELQVEKLFPLDVLATLKANGYTIKRDGEADEHNPGVWGDSELISVDPITKILSAGQDKRHHFGKAAGY